ncbi:histidine phosphatase family protein [Micromonospora sp. H61]|uniref:histidine phosphatase family protein n=1 Tax=Micromonospora sp. H61 TaxID=2824888 RepID=UPI0035A91699
MAPRRRWSEVAESRQLVFLRHAPTISNHKQVYMGSLDVPASPEGLQLAAASAEDWDSFNFTVCYCSPLSRASATAEMLFPQLIPVPDVRLSERHLGEWQGMPKGEVRSRFPQAFLASGHLDPGFTPPGGESLEAFSARIEGFLADAGSRGESEVPAVVCHNGWIRTALHLIGQIPLHEIYAADVEFLVPTVVDIVSPRGAGATR